MFTKHLLPAATVAGIAAAGLALTACGASSNGGSSSTTPQAADVQDQVLAFARCMREHGVDMPDPEVDAKGRVRMRVGGANTPRATMEAAQDACEDTMPQLGGDGVDDGANREFGLKLAQCMREHGIERFPDPTDGGIRITPDMGINPSDPAFQEAQKACEDEVGDPPAPGEGS